MARTEAAENEQELEHQRGRQSSQQLVKQALAGSNSWRGNDVEHVPAVALATTTCYGGRYHRYAQRGTHLLDHLLASANHLAAHGSDDLINLSLFNRRQQEV